MNQPPLFLSYLHDRRHPLMIYLGMVLCFCAVILLYGLPPAAAGYALLLSLCVGLVGLAWDFFHYRRRHLTLTALLHSITLGTEGLPEAASLTEGDYQALIHALSREMQRRERAFQGSADDMEDYYTLWAHQIKVPLSALTLLVQTQQHDPNALRQEIFRIEQYVEMALSYIRLESPSSDFVLRECPLDGIIRGCLRKYARLFILSGVSLGYAGTEVRVLTDEKWLAFVLEQLLSNAIKYSPNGSIRIRADENSLTISDTGVGIDPADLPRIFEKGFTGYNGREEQRSSGLGLYLSKKVLDKLSHKIALRSAPGEGTEVCISFPDCDFSPE